MADRADMLAEHEGVSGIQRLAGELADLLVAHLFMLIISVVLYIIYSLLGLFFNIQLPVSIICLMALLVVWLPWTIVAAWIEHRFQASLGQLMLNLALSYQQTSLVRCWVRSALKYFPYLMVLLSILWAWLGEASLGPILLVVATIGYIIVVWLMIARHTDHRHWIDWLVGSQVVMKNKSEDHNHSR